MKLTYDVLWFEDQFDALRRTVNRFENSIKRKGLIPNIVKKDKISKEDVYLLQDKLDKSNPYDLIIFDFDMGVTSLDGIEIAQILRTSIYTDMVFYSGKKPAELKRMIFDAGIEGVFTAYKNKLIDDVEPIIDDQIKKYSSLNGARGLIMSESSDFDIQLRRKISAHIDNITIEESEALLEKIKTRLTKKFGQATKTISRKSLKEIVLSSIIMDSDTLRKTCKDIIDEEFFSEGGEFQKMQQERNFLAHNPHVLLDNGDIQVTRGTTNKTYNHQEFQRVRKDLIEVKKKLQAFYE